MVCSSFIDRNIWNWDFFPNLIKSNQNVYNNCFLRLVHISGGYILNGIVSFEKQEPKAEIKLKNNWWSGWTECCCSKFPRGVIYEKLCLSLELKKFSSTIKSWTNSTRRTNIWNRKWFRNAKTFRFKFHDFLQLKFFGIILQVCFLWILIRICPLFGRRILSYVHRTEFAHEKLRVW